MHSLTLFLALLACACTSPDKPPTPARAAPTPASMGLYDFSDLAGEEIGLTRFIGECQARTKFSFTYDAEAGAVMAKSDVIFRHDEPLTPEAFKAALDQVLQPCGLEARHIGPAHLRVLELRVRR
jgi:hypothetical protein